jgi:hypothetical protein
VKYALVIIETPASRHAIQVDRATHRAALEDWMGAQAAAGRLVDGEAFETEAERPATIRRAGLGQVTVTNEPFAGDAETLGGYVIVDVKDRDEAIDVARSWPDTGETIEVRPLWAPA